MEIFPAGVSIWIGTFAGLAPGAIASHKNKYFPLAVTLERDRLTLSLSHFTEAPSRFSPVARIMMSDLRPTHQLGGSIFVIEGAAESADTDNAAEMEESQRGSERELSAIAIAENNTKLFRSKREDAVRGLRTLNPGTSRIKKRSEYELAPLSGV